jgi:thymidylate synthase (FAD)
MNNTRSVDAYGFVRLDGVMADDLSVVNSARVSFAKHSDKIGEAEDGLINFLMRERHGTPFEHNSFRFHVSCPLFVAREWFRHRIGSFNEFSARYTEVGDRFFIPNTKSMRTQTGKPGAYQFNPMDGESAHEAIMLIGEHNEIAYATYKHLIELGVAKELARTVLPVGMYTEFFWTVNARSLMNFLSLRTAETAQQEIRQYAKQVEMFFEENMPVTYGAWLACGKICP